MDVDEIVEVISAGLCRGDKRTECVTCQRKLRAIEAVRAMGAVCEAARGDSTPKMVEACRAINGGEHQYKWRCGLPRGHSGRCVDEDAIDVLRGDHG